MKRYLVIPALLITSFATEASEGTLSQSHDKAQYRECVAVSLYTIQGKELNSIVKDNRTINDTNAIPEGWSVVGVTTKKEALVTTPHLVICH